MAQYSGCAAERLDATITAYTSSNTVMDREICAGIVHGRRSTGPGAMRRRNRACLVAVLGVDGLAGAEFEHRPRPTFCASCWQMHFDARRSAL
jgi:hypothetical protein